MKRLCSLLLTLTMCLSVLTIAQAVELTDVPEDAAYAEAVQWAVDQGLMCADENGAFSPDTTMTRGQMIELLWHEAGEPVHNLESNRFLDISPSMSCYNGVLWADEKDITAGYSENIFGTSDPCTDAQVITFLWRVDGMPAVPQSKPIADHTGAYYADALAWADYMGMLDADRFDPAAALSRGELAHLLYLKSMPQISEEAPLSAAGQLTVSQQPVSMEPSGGMVTFKVQASGGKPPYTHTWESKTGSGSWFRVYDTTSNTLTKFPAASMISSGLYFRCVISDAAGSKVTSDEVKVLQPGESFSGGSGSSQSGNATSDSAPLTIKTHPADAQVVDGSAVTFKVEVSGGKAPYTYKWESKTGSSGWTRVYDSVSNTLTKFPAQSMIDSGLFFRCVISDAEGTAVVTDEAQVLPIGQSGAGTSTGSSVPTAGQLAISQQPRDTNAAANGNVTFTVGVSGGKAPYVYQWQSLVGDTTWVNLYDTTTNTLSKQLSRPMIDAGMYFRCVVSDAAGSQVTTEAAKALAAGESGTVPSDGELRFAAQPVDVLDAKGSEIVFQVLVKGGKAPYSYMWESRTDSTSWAQDHTSYAAELVTYPTAAMANEGLRFRCTVTDGKGTQIVSKEARVWGTSQKTLQIIDQPDNIFAEVQPGGSVKFHVKASGGTPPYRYQWQMDSVYGEPGFVDLFNKNAGLKTGYDTDTLTVPFVLKCLEDNQRFRCVVSDATGNTVASQPAGFDGAYLGPVIVEAPREHVFSNNQVREVSYSVKVRGGTQPYIFLWQYIHDGLTEYKDFTAADTWASKWNEQTMYTTSHPPYPNTLFRCIVIDAADTKVISSPGRTLIDP